MPAIVFDAANKCQSSEPQFYFKLEKKKLCHNVTSGKIIFSIISRKFYL